MAEKTSTQSRLWAQQLPGGGTVFADHLLRDQTGVTPEIMPFFTWLGEVAACAFDQSQPLKVDRKSQVYRVDACERQWVIKRYVRPAWRNGLEHWLRRSRAWREWQAGRLLTQHHIRCNPALLLIHPGRRDPGAQYLVFQYQPGLTLDHLLDHDWLCTRSNRPGEVNAQEVEQAIKAARDVGIDLPLSLQARKTIAAAIGSQLGRMGRLGLINRDPKPGNLLIDRVVIGEGEEPVLLDVGQIGNGPVEQGLAILRWECWLFGQIGAAELAAFSRAFLEAWPEYACDESTAGSQGRVSRDDSILRRSRALRQAVEQTRITQTGTLDAPKRIGSPRP